MSDRRKREGLPLLLGQTKPRRKNLNGEMMIYGILKRQELT